MHFDTTLGALLPLDGVQLLEPHREERILICLTGRPSSANLIRRGKRVADYLQADCLAVVLADAEAGLLGLAHAGWRGALAGLPGLLAKRLGLAVELAR